MAIQRGRDIWANARTRRRWSGPRCSVSGFRGPSTGCWIVVNVFGLSGQMVQRTVGLPATEPKPGWLLSPGFSNSPVQTVDARDRASVISRPTFLFRSPEHGATVSKELRLPDLPGNGRLSLRPCGSKLTRPAAEVVLIRVSNHTHNAANSLSCFWE